jgi:hypothetical protein
MLSRTIRPSSRIPNLEVKATQSTRPLIPPLTNTPSLQLQAPPAIQPAIQLIQRGSKKNTPLHTATQPPAPHSQSTYLPAQRRRYDHDAARTAGSVLAHVLTHARTHACAISRDAGDCEVRQGRVKGGRERQGGARHGMQGGKLEDCCAVPDLLESTSEGGGLEVG